MGLDDRSQSGRSSWVNFLVLLGKRIDRHDLTSLSAEISYYFCLALFPFLILLAAIIGLLPFTHLWDDSLQRIVQYFPQDIQGVLWDTVGSLVQAHGSFLSLGILGTVWAASGGLMTLTSALNVVYEVQETRSYLRRLGIAVLMVFVLIVLLVATFGLLSVGSLFDQRLVSARPASRLLPLLAAAARWAITIVVAFVCISLIEGVLPNCKRPWRWMAPGTLVVAAGWLLGPLGFNVYIQRIASYHKTYGVLGAFVVLMVWFYISSLIALIGAEINSMLGESAKGRDRPGVGLVPAPGVMPLGEMFAEGEGKQGPR
ncbi:MAG TPA: YihY/virulence factor BrkB family protein [Terriglobia bacterium]|nr:YihY/virulence factor BrkB family protein [Terriglobia bacterium]